jgi:NADH:ubiquinone oxidoreductase subunit 6 (subunit J)
MNTIKCPPTVWLTQLLLILFALLFLFISLFNLVNLLPNLGTEISILRPVVVYSIAIGMGLLFLRADWGLGHGKMYGKWLGLLSLILLWALVIFRQFHRLSNPYKYYRLHKYPVELGGEVIFQLFLHSLFLILIFRLSFSKRVKEYFRQERGPS